MPEEGEGAEEQDAAPAHEEEVDPAVARSVRGPALQFRNISSHGLDYLVPRNCSVGRVGGAQRRIRCDTPESPGRPRHHRRQPRRAVTALLRERCSYRRRRRRGCRRQHNTARRRWRAVLGHCVTGRRCRRNQAEPAEGGACLEPDGAPVLVAIRIPASHPPPRASVFHRTSRCFHALPSTRGAQSLLNSSRLIPLGSSRPALRRSSIHSSQSRRRHDNRPRTTQQPSPPAPPRRTEGANRLRRGRQRLRLWGPMRMRRRRVMGARAHHRHRRRRRRALPFRARRRRRLGRRSMPR